LLIELPGEIGQSCPVSKNLPARKEYRDDWGTGAREGYEDRGVFRPPRAPQKEPGSSVLRVLGGLAIVGGIFWGVFLVTRGGDAVTVLQQNHGPVAVIGLGVISSLLGKYLRI
jgi:hypothetical protein